MDPIQARSGDSHAGRKLRVTQRRIDANRRNAARSTGPRTREGKAKVRLNALRHGLRARDDIYLAAAGEEARSEIAELAEELSRDLRVQRPHERVLVSQIAHAFWKLARAFELEERERVWEWPQRPAEHDRLLSLMDALTRYQTKADLELHRAFRALFRLRRLTRRENQRTNPLAQRIARQFKGFSAEDCPQPDSFVTLCAKKRTNRACHPLPQPNPGAGTIRLATPTDPENDRTKPLASHRRASGSAHSKRASSPVAGLVRTEFIPPSETVFSLAGDGINSVPTGSPNSPRLVFPTAPFL